MNAFEQGRHNLEESKARFDAAATEFMQACKEIAPRHGMSAQEVWTWILANKKWEIEPNG